GVAWALLRIGFGLATQEVVRAESDDDEADAARVKRPVNAPDAAGRGVARNTRVDHLVLDAVRVNHLLQQSRVVLLRREAVAGGQAVAEGDDFRQAFGGRRRLARPGGRGVRRRS